MENNSETVKHVSNQLLIISINSRKWAEASKIVYNDEAYVRIKDNTGNLPIHLAVKFGCTHDLIVRILTAFPECAGIKDSAGNLPLHLAAHHHKGRLWINIREITFTLIEAYPSGLREFDKNNNLAVQIAIRSRAPDDLIRFFLQQFPDSAYIQDRQGNTLLHLAIQFECSLDVVSELIELHPDSPSVVNKMGALPLHKAAHFNASFEVLQLVHDTFPAACSVADNRGNFPMHLMFLCCGGRPAENKQRLLLTSYPLALSAVNKNGCTPFMMMSCPQDYVEDYI